MDAAEETEEVLPDEFEGEGVPFVEGLTEDDTLSKKMAASPEEEEKSSGDDADGEVDSEKPYLDKIMAELDAIEAAGMEGYVNERYNYAYGEYKRGLKSLSDLVIGRKAEEDPALKAAYMRRRRKFCANAAAACIKINHWQQGLEACALILEEGPDDEAQRRKALFRAGVCARGTGDIDEAAAFLRKLREAPDLDPATRRAVRSQLKGIAEERRRYRIFCRGIVSKENQDSIIVPEKKELTEEDFERMAKLEKKREDYQKRKKDEAERGDPMRTEPTKPEVMMTEEAAIGMLDALAERYGDPKIQDELKEAAYQHEMEFTKGFILKSRMILAPLQQDLLVKHCFLDPSDVLVNDASPPGVDGETIPETAEIAMSGKFDASLGELLLVGEGVLERSETTVYSVALYTDEKTKASVSSTPKSEAMGKLRAALKSHKRAAFLLKMEAELSVQDMVGEILSIVPAGTPNHGYLAANVSGVIYGSERKTFPKGTSIRFDCTAHGAKFAADGEELGSVGAGFSEALLDGYLKDSTASPPLRLSLVENCCGGEGKSKSEEAIPGKDGGEANKIVAKAESAKAHFDAVRKFQHTVRYLSAKTKNRQIADKAELCQKLAVGLLYEDGMKQTGWVSL